MPKQPASAKPRPGGASSFRGRQSTFSPKKLATGLALKFSIAT
jgi:hypothetical protein